MKPIIPSALLGALLVGVASAATTTPVGYETLNLSPGFNYVGLRLQQSQTFAGTFETVAPGQLIDTGANIQGALAANTLYLVEIVDGPNAGVDPGTGAIAEIVSTNVTGGTISVTHNFNTLGVTNGASYVIRASATLSSVFGPANEAGLAPGSFGPGGADVVFVPNTTGGFDQYYYDIDEASWSKVASPNPILISGSSVPLVYLDSMIINSTGTGTNKLTVAGEVKTDSVYQGASTGFNYFGSVFPVGATLGSAYNGSIASLDQGSFGPGGADVFLLPNGPNFDQYYYDADEASWSKVASPNPILVDPNTVPLPPGFIFSNVNGPVNILNSAPSFYSSL